MEHEVYTHKQGEFDAKNDIDLEIMQAVGDVDKGLENAMKRLNSTENWTADDQYSAKEVRNRIAQQLHEVGIETESGREYLAKLHAADDMISAKRSQLGQALEAGKEAPLSSENMSQK